MAVWPDDSTKKRLGALERELGRTKGLRFVGPARWHVTLRFLGDVDSEGTDRLARALEAAAARFTRPVECRLGPGTGWYTAVRVLHLPATGVDALAAAVRTATLPLVRSDQDEKPFNAHLTLARSKGRRLGVSALGDMANIPFEAAFPVHAVDLVASRSSPDGPVYTTVTRAPLGSAPSVPEVSSSPPRNG